MGSEREVAMPRSFACPILGSQFKEADQRRNQVVRIVVLNNVPVKSKLQQPPGQPPGHLNVWKISVQIPKIAVQMPPSRGNKSFYFI